MAPPVTDGPSGGWFRDGTGRIRSGWVIAAFALVAVASNALLEGLIWAAGLRPDSPYSLDDAKIGLTTLAHLVSGVLATLVAWRMGQETGLQRPRGLAWGAAAAAVLLSVSVAVAAAVSGSMGTSSCSTLLTAGVLQLALVGPTGIGE